MTLKAGNRLISVRDGDNVQQITMIDALIRSQQTSALKGSPFAQRQAIETYERADAERRAQVTESNAWWEDRLPILRKVFGDAERAGLPPPRIFPHPDDIIIDPVRGVRFVGPIGEEEDAKLQETLRFRDLLII